MAAMAVNRRQHPRVRAHGLSAHLRSMEGRRACLVENVSLGGLFVRTDRLEEVGTELFVDLLRPGWKKMLTVLARTTSRVDVVDGRLSSRMPGMGMQFMRLDEKQHERLRALLRELGAPDEESELTIAPEDGSVLGAEEEPELRALATKDEPPPAEMAEQPAPKTEDAPLTAPAGGQPIWQQVEMVAEAIERELKGIPPPPPLDADDAAVRRLQPDTRRVSADIAERLRIQVRGLSLQLSDAQQLLMQREAEIERLREELELTREALREAQRRR